VHILSFFVKKSLNLLKYTLKRGFSLKLFSHTFNVLEQGLDYSSLKQKVISHNIANVDTPNYKAKQVHFKTELNNALQSLKAYRTHPKHFEFKKKTSSYFSVMTRNDVVYNHNGNSVDIDKEMSDLAENQIYYNALVERLNSKFNSLKNVIRGGK
jgi:flagellar basal-body rod protein FlgB